MLSFVLFSFFAIIVSSNSESAEKILGEALALKEEINGNAMLDESTILQTICLNEINAERQKNGNLAPLQFDSKLDTSAYNHNSWMVLNNCFSHQCPGEPSLGERITDAGYHWAKAGEIIAAGSQNCEQVVNLWMNSPGHRAIILGDYRHIGCSGLYCREGCDYGVYWTCNMATPR